MDMPTAYARHNRTNLGAHGLVSGASWGATRSQRVGTLMTTFQAVMLGVMLALTPSLAVLAFLIWREGIGLVEKDSESGPHWSHR
jgi:hypothetical protein